MNEWTFSSHQILFMHLCQITNMFVFKNVSSHESISSTPCRTHKQRRVHTNTDHFLWVGKGSYWRILSGKRTFSNKWWWTLDEKTIGSSSFFFVFFIYNQHCTLLGFFFPVLCSIPDKCQIEEVWTSRFQAFGPWVYLSRKESRPHCFLNPEWKNRFGHMWRCWSVCELCLSRFGTILYGSPFLPESCVNLTHVSYREKHPLMGKKLKKPQEEEGSLFLHRQTRNRCLLYKAVQLIEITMWTMGMTK